MEANLCSFFYHLFIYVFPLEIQLSRGEGWDPINRFNPATFLCLFKARTWIFNVSCCSLFYVQWVEVIGGCSFCWYWWNCWPYCLNFLCIIKIKRGKWQTMIHKTLRSKLKIEQHVNLLVGCLFPLLEYYRKTLRNNLERHNNLPIRRVWRYQRGNQNP